MANITFEDRAVAFIDVLGFKNIVQLAATKNDYLTVLNDLVTLLESAVPTLDTTVSHSAHPSLKPKFIYVSDSIILSAPITSPHMSSYNGLNVVVMRVIQIAHILLEKGFIVSGGIDIGKVWHSENNIVGPAYIGAYALQSALAPPCVALSNAAAQLWGRTPNAGSTMCIDRRRRMIVNVTHDYYIPNNHVYGAIDSRIKCYKTDALDNTSKLKGRPRRKWQWHSAFLEKYAQSA